MNIRVVLNQLEVSIFSLCGSNGMWGAMACGLLLLIEIPLHLSPINDLLGHGARIGLICVSPTSKVNFLALHCIILYCT